MSDSFLIALVVNSQKGGPNGAIKNKFQWDYVMKYEIRLVMSFAIHLLRCFIDVINFQHLFLHL